MKDTAFRPFYLNISGQIWHAKQPVIVGVINATPDSFYAKSRSVQTNDIITAAENLVLDGADWIDIGGCSTRPGADTPSIEEEWLRIESSLKELVKKFPNVPISIDTFRSEIAQKAIDTGASIVNDISGGTIDPKIWNVVAKNKVPYVLTHYPQGSTPKNMQNEPLGSKKVFSAVFQELSASIDNLHSLGVNDLLIDPGFGFGKTIESNYKLMSDLSGLKELNHPIYIGISRKSMLWKLLDSSPNEMLPASSAIHLYALEKGAQILRVHDPKEANQIRTIWKSLCQ